MCLGEPRWPMVRGCPSHNMVVEERRRCRWKNGRLVPVSPRINISLINFSSPRRSLCASRWWARPEPGKG